MLKQTRIIIEVYRQTHRPTLAFLTLVIVLAAAILACGGDEAAPQTPSDPDSAGLRVETQLDERLFLLEPGGLYELTGGMRELLFARPDKAFIYDVAVEPHGSRIALTIQQEPQQTAKGYDFGVDLYVTEDGDNLIELAVHEHIGEVMSRPTWLPGGKELLFAILGRNEDGGADIRIERIEISTAARARLIDDAMEPALSPDASTLAYVLFDRETGFERLKLYDMATGESRPLLEDKLMFNVGNLTWAPDGSRLVFAAADPPLPGAGMSAGALHPTLRDVWVIDADGSNLSRVVELADATLSLAWSQDGRHVYAVGDTGFWFVDIDEGSFERLGPPVLGGRVQTLFPEQETVVDR